MPELPDAENVARELSRVAVGKRIIDVSFREPKALNLPPEAFQQKVKGRIAKVQRRAKEVVLFLEDDGTLWLHMGLRSQVGYTSRDRLPSKPFLALLFDDGTAFYMDKTFMGHAHFVSGEELPVRWAEYGIDPLDATFTLDKLRQILQGRKGQSIKSVLMDQRVIAGIGNIFSDEILHAAEIHPERKAGSLSEEQIKHLYHAIREVLLRAVEAGGGPEWVNISGRESAYKAEVHGQEFCQRHNAPVHKVSFSGRTAYVCEATKP